MKNFVFTLGVALLLSGALVSKIVKAEVTVPQSMSCEFSELIALGMMAKYDENKDGLLSFAESLTAFPVYVGTIKERLSAQGSAEPATYMSEAAYTYSMRYLRFPNSRGWQGATNFANWLARRPFWNRLVLPLDQAKVGQMVATILCLPQE